jgi:hypothetical protein
MLLRVPVSLLRRKGLLPQQRITREDALVIARVACASRGWPWKERVSVQERLWGWRVMTNIPMRGGNAFIWIDGRTGEVVGAGFARM